MGSFNSVLNLHGLIPLAIMPEVIGQPWTAIRAHDDSRIRSGKQHGCCGSFKQGERKSGASRGCRQLYAKARLPGRCNLWCWCGEWTCGQCSKPGPTDQSLGPITRVIENPIARPRESSQNATSGKLARSFY